MPAFSSGPISQMQSPAGRTFIVVARSTATSDVDDDTRIPAGPTPLESELVERHRLRIGAQHGPSAVDEATRETRRQRGRRRGHAYEDVGENELFAVLEEDQLRHPVVKEQV